MNNTERAYEFLREKIISGDYLPGEDLLPNELEKEIKVSRTPIRDALRMLETDGLVEIKTKSGAKVRPISAKDFREICEVRLALEGYGAALAANRHSEDELSKIQFYLEQMEEKCNSLTKSENPYNALPELAILDSRFHLSISAASRNDLIVKEITRMNVILRVLAGWTKSQLQYVLNESSWRQRRIEIQLEHRKIFEAIKDRDSIGAKSAMEAHIRNISDIEIIELEKNTTQYYHSISGI